MIGDIVWNDNCNRNNSLYFISYSYYVYPQIWILNVMAVQELQNERGHYAIAFLTTLLCNIINDTVVP